MSMPNALEGSDILARIASRDHLCHLYRGREQQSAVIVPWLRQAIARAEPCLLIADECELGPIQAALNANGIPCGSGLGRSLRVITINRDRSTPDPSTTYNALGPLLDDVYAEVALLGTPTLWLAADATWLLQATSHAEALRWHERWFSRATLPQQRTLCQFNLQRSNLDVLDGVLDLQAYVIFEGACYDREHFGHLRARLAAVGACNVAHASASADRNASAKRASEVRHRSPEDFLPDASAVQTPARADVDEPLEHGALTLLLESMPAGVLLTDAAGLVTYANARAEAILKKTGRELRGQAFGSGVWKLSTISGQPITDDWLPISRVRKTGLANFDTRLAIEWSRDSRSYVSINAAPLGYAEGQPRGTILLITDISESVTAELEHQRARTQSSQSQKMEAIATLASGVAHDFNNLLGGILASASAMDLQLGEGFKFHEDLSEIKALVERGAELTRQLLGFAHRGKYVPTLLDLNAITSELGTSFGRTRKDIEIRLVTASPFAFVSGDKGQIQQVLVNLLLNSRKAMPNGGTITLSTEAIMLTKADVAAYGTSPGRYIRLAVSDTGIGMSDRTRQRVFEPFFTTGQLGRGTGLGLASVFGIVKNHGGFVTVQSAPAAGATFAVYLPASKHVAGAEPLPERPHTGQKGTILIVDDEPYILRSSQRLLKAMGYPVLTARGGREAIEVLKQGSGVVDLVILDMIMPDMNGRQTFEALRAIDPDLKVLLCSGHSSDGEVGEILQHGCSGFIQKPFDTDALSAKLAEVM